MSKFAAEGGEVHVISKVGGFVEPLKAGEIVKVMVTVWGLTL